MAGKAHARERYRLLHSPVFCPEDWLRFIHLTPFERHWHELRLTDDDLVAVQLAIMAGPKLSPVIPGTGGLRKLRYGPRGWSKGKSGGLRIGYAYFEEHSVVLLVVAYRKGRKDNLSRKECAEIADVLRAIGEHLDRERSDHASSKGQQPKVGPRPEEAGGRNP